MNSQDFDKRNMKTGGEQKLGCIPPKIARYWLKKPQIVDTSYGQGISVVFTWQLNDALLLANKIGTNLVGGPGATLLGYAPLEGGDIIKEFNPFATFTTRGCIKQCPFCAVPKLEGQFRELQIWRCAPMVCDNNILAASFSHFKKVIDGLVGFGWADFNQGLDFRLLKPKHLQEISRIKHPIIRLAFDDIKYESSFVDAVAMIKNAGYHHLSAYILIGFNDTPEDALYRLGLCWSLGVWPNPMRYQPIDTHKKNSYVANGWTDEELKKMMRYWANLRITSPIPYSEFNNHYHSKGKNK